MTLKVMPRPESERTLMLRGLDDVAANRAMTAALGSPFDVSGAAHLPNSAFRAAVAALGGPRIAAAGGHAAAAGGHHGVGGPSRGCARPRLLAPFGAAEILRRCRLRGGLEFGSRRPAVRGQRRAGRVAGVADRLSAGFRRRARRALSRDTGGDVIYDWGGGLIWAALPPKPDAQAALVRQRVDAAGGHAMLDPRVRAGPARRRCVPSAAGRPCRAWRTRPPQLRSRRTSSIAAG